jgi:septal ring factor EnvC (AmiA/AmiB activator)
MGSKYTDYSDATIDSLWDKIAAKDKRIAELEKQLATANRGCAAKDRLREKAEAKVKELEAELQQYTVKWDAIEGQRPM